MRDYYQHARNIYYVPELLSERMSLTPPNPDANTGTAHFSAARAPPRIEHFDGFYSADASFFATAGTFLTKSRRA